MTWPTKKLSEVIDKFDRGISWSRKDESSETNGAAVLRIPNILQGKIIKDDLRYIKVIQQKEIALDKDDILMVASNGNPDLVARSALVTEAEQGMLFASFLVRLRFNRSKILAKYAQLFFTMPFFKREIRRKIATTSGIYNLKKEHVEKLQIPLPPIDIQCQIVERLDAIKKAQELNDKQIVLADELFQSALHKELKARNKNWEVKKLNEIVEILYGEGLSKSDRVEDGKYFAYGSNGPVCRTNKILVNYPTIIIGRKGAAGVLYLVKDPSWPIDTTFYTKIKNEKIIDLDFLFFLLQTKNLQNLAIVTAVPGINRDSLYNLKITLPSLQTQRQIVSKLQSVQDYKKKLLDQKQKLQELFESCLDKAMKGN